MTNKTNNEPINIGIRLGAMILDHFFMTMIAMLFFIPGFISIFSDAFNVTHDQANLNILSGTIGYLGMFGFALYFCKDSFNGRSIAKRILKLQVVDIETGQPASPLKCLIRNSLCIIWPIEVIVALSNTNRRLGDKIAGTQLVRFDPSIEQPRINFGKTVLPVAISYGFMLLLLQVMPKFGMSRPMYSETSYNQVESRQLESLIDDRLGQYMVSDVRIYDTIKNENLKFISVILKLKANYIEDDSKFRELYAASTGLIYSKYPLETFTGRIKFVYKAAGQMQSSSTTIGTSIKSESPQ